MNEFLKSVLVKLIIFVFYYSAHLKTAKAPFLA